MTFWAPKTVVEGKEVKAVLADFSSRKIDRAVWPSYASSELPAATISEDAWINLLLLYEQVFHVLKARQVKEKLTQGKVAHVLVTDNKGLYDETRPQSVSMVCQILSDFEDDYGVNTFLVSRSHMLAEMLTKLSASGAQVHAVQKILENSRIRIISCTASGRKEQHEIQDLKSLKPASKGLQSLIDG